MAEGLLVSSYLTQEMVCSGRRAIEALEHAGLPMLATYWEYVEEGERWRLVLISPELPVLGPLSIFRKIDAALAAQASEPMALDTLYIDVQSDTQPFYRRLMLAPHADPQQRRDINNFFDSEHYVYWVA
ncbi:hypothetical protein [Massilia sp. BJB1822]|uniref:hypothetical protein n=1 Tax=Massilia sp. BJB1822 TaxID=2744470 RepID=UPI0015932CFF|nr:hypothetical protein [Massilia sp. BJB1822]NVD99151.1 hypothetical protein [Massilia sp. BJB1822]